MRGKGRGRKGLKREEKVLKGVLTFTPHQSSATGSTNTEFRSCCIVFLFVFFKPAVSRQSWTSGTFVCMSPYSQMFPVCSVTRETV